MMISRIVDFFIHPHYHSDAKSLRRARLFVRSCLLTSLFSNSYIWLSWLFEYEKAIYLMIFNVIGFLLLALLAKTKLSILLLGNLYVLVGAIAVIVLSYFSGGLWSAIFPWLIAIPVLALLVVNRRSGVIWGIISLIIMLWFGWLAYQAIELPVDYNTDYKTEWFISIATGLLMIVLIIALVFESIQTKALRDLEGQNKILNSQKGTIAEQSSELEKLIEAKDYIIRILAHDLKNPLSNITLVANLLKKAKNENDRKKYIDIIEKASSNANGLVDRVLEMETLNQDAELNMKVIDLEKSLNKLIASMIEIARKKRIQITQLNKSSNCKVRGDEIYIHQIFQNLISNAIKFSDNDTSVNAIISNTDTHVRVEIVDQGPGIVKGEEESLFKKFSKLSSKPTAGESSTGLGLALVKEYVDKIGGEVWYDKSSVNGSTFVVQFPTA